jgi:hypothetical protein
MDIGRYYKLIYMPNLHAMREFYASADAASYFEVQRRRPHVAAAGAGLHYRQIGEDQHTVALVAPAGLQNPVILS